MNQSPSLSVGWPPEGDEAWVGVGSQVSGMPSATAAPANTSLSPSIGGVESRGSQTVSAWKGQVSRLFAMPSPSASRRLVASTVKSMGPAVAGFDLNPMPPSFAGVSGLSCVTPNRVVVVVRGVQKSEIAVGPGGDVGSSRTLTLG